MTSCQTHPRSSAVPAILPNDSSIGSHFARDAFISCFITSSRRLLNAPYLASIQLVAFPEFRVRTASSHSLIEDITFFITEL
jgi:hypothetical protein